MQTVQDLRAAGFSDDEISQWSGGQRQSLSVAGFTDAEINDHLTGIKLLEKPPAAFLDRITEPGQRPTSETSEGGEKASFGERLGRALAETGVQLFDMVIGAANPKAYLESVEGIVNPPPLEDIKTGRPLTPEEIEAQVPDRRGIAQFGLMHIIPHTSMLGRTAVAPDGAPYTESIGGLPSHMDFVDASTIIAKEPPPPLRVVPSDPSLRQRPFEGEPAFDARKPIAANDIMGPSIEPNPGGGFDVHTNGPMGVLYATTIEQAEALARRYGPHTASGAEVPVPLIEQKLLELYTEHGVHPSEVAADAARDPMVRQELLSVNPGLPERYTGKPPITIEEIPAEGGAGGPPEPPRIEPPTVEGEPQEGPPTPEKPLTSEDARQKILDQIDVGGRKEKEGYSLSRLYTDLIDKFNPIKKLTREAELPAETDPYVAFRETVASGTKAHEMLMGQGVWDFNAPHKGPISRSLRQILEPVRNVEDLDTFRAFAAAARAIELDRRGIETPFDIEAATKVVRDNVDRMQPILTELIDFQNKVTKWLRDTGVLSDRAYIGMMQANLIYVPFHRGAERLLHRITGSSEAIIDPLESIIKNTYMNVQVAERNYAKTQLVDFLDKKGEAPLVDRGMIPTTAPHDLADFSAWLEHYGIPKASADELSVFVKTASEIEDEGGTITLFRDGKRERRSVDEDVARAVSSMDKESVGRLMRLLSNWTSLLRAGSTLVPEFGGRHLMRDFLYAFVTAKEGVFSPHWMIRGAMNYVKQGEVYREWIRSGGANVTYQAFDRQYLQEDLRKLTNETGLMSRAWNVIASPTMTTAEKAGIAFRATLHPLQVFTELAQSASHLGAFERALLREGEGREALIRAGWESRETAVDISRRGAKMQAANQIIAFMNATIQDTDRWIRALREKPATTAFRISAGITIPSIILWAAQHDDPDYQEVHRWEKDLFWVIGVGKGPPSEVAKAAGKDSSPNFFVRIPKPWGMGLLFGSGAERMLDGLYAQKPEAFKDFLSSVWEMNVPSLVPTPLVPPTEQWANKSFFTGRPLIPSRVEKLLPEYQYNDYTTETAKSIGHAIGAFYPGGAISPMILEHYLSGWTGRLGQYVLDASDVGLRKAGVIPDPPKPASTLSDVPVIKAFISRYPSATTQSIEDFHQEFSRREVLYHTFIEMAKQGDVEAARHIQDIGGPQMFMRLSAIQQTLSQQQQVIHNISRNPDISASDKRQLIDTLYGQMTNLSRIGNSAMGY